MGGSGEYAYLIAFGSNRRQAPVGAPAKIIRQAFDAMEMADIGVFAVSAIRRSRPLGPSQREYANAAAIVVTILPPPALLARFKTLEAHFGRRSGGQRWTARSLDIDIILWSGGHWNGAQPRLIIPHPEWCRRHFVLQPAAEIAGDWRDPASGLRVKHLWHRNRRANRLDPERTAN